MQETEICAKLCVLFKSWKNITDFSNKVNRESNLIGL